MADGKKLKDRSPRYPSMSLREAVEKAKALYRNEKRAMVPIQVAVKSWGYGSLHGVSLTILAGMTQYGLLVRKKGLVGISQEAFTILEAPRDSPERLETLRICSRSPAIFAELLDKHKDSLPSDDAIKWDLKQKGFADQAAQSVIACLRDTISFVDEEVKGYIGGNESEDQERPNAEEPPMSESNTANQRPIGTPASHSAAKRPGDWVLPLGEGTVSLSWSGVTPTADTLEALRKYLEVFKTVFKGANKETTNEQGPSASL